jgi:adenylate cyclase
MTRHARYWIIIGMLLGPAIYGNAQDAQIDSLKAFVASEKEDTARVNALLLLSSKYTATSPDDAIKFGVKARTLSIKLGFRKGQAYALKNIGIGYYKQGKYLDALVVWHTSLSIFEALHDQEGIANIENNLGAVNYNQGDDANALENYLKSLEVSEKIGNKYRMATALQNIGSVYLNKKTTHEKALDYFIRALTLGEAEHYDDVVGATTVNLGEIYMERGQEDSALYYFKKSLFTLQASQDTASIPYTLNDIGKVYAARKDFGNAREYHEKALDISRKLEAKLDIVQSILGLANTYLEEGSIKPALGYYKEAEKIALEINSKQDLKNAYSGLATSYSKMPDYRNAYKYQALLTGIKDSIYNTETDKKLATLGLNFEIQKKQGEINLLTKDKALQELDLKKQKIAKNSLTAGLILIFFIAFTFYRNYRAKVKTNKILDRQKVEIEGLLLNILPSEVAEELQREGRATPRYYENVSVLFTDFKGFTKHADVLSPQEIVSELNACFIAFDDIIDKFHLEKIKTIGDSYMCAGGIPTVDEQHPINIIKAGMEIRDCMKALNEKRKESGQPVWDLRIGIHIGPVVAGVVGRKKYAYDIWGSTVNIASRMESNGEPGEINISAATYGLIKDQYACTYRGKIFAKNIGEIDMYFVEGERTAVEKIPSLERVLVPQNLNTEVTEGAGKH